MTEQNKFISDVRDHVLTIELDQPPHRCLSFRRPGSSAYAFRIVTWPGHLAISGDCEDFTFARLTDMFEFFRGETLNLSYWSEKLQSPARNKIYQAFSPERYAAAIKTDFDDWSFDSDADKARAWDRLNDSWDGLIGAAPQDEGEAIRAAMDYKCPVTGNTFDEFYEHRVWDYSYHFTWACQAIVWGIAQYDRAKAERNLADDDRLVLAGAQ